MIKMEILKIPLGSHQRESIFWARSGQHIETPLKYVPDCKEDRHENVICHGDQLSVERMIKSRICMALSWEPKHRLQALIPRLQGFHKRCLLMQVSIIIWSPEIH